ncbi:MAG: Glutathione import ATP-binding protein GsiA [Lentisphaerae bacterium ADurb.BinA184]|nr:MAG: Glutathione import ATP-binding protein GsiA [Lentisphaerae bacterium ADurb.BinA184]
MTVTAPTRLTAADAPAPSTAVPLLSIRDLAVTYHGHSGDVPAVQGFSAEVFPGDAVAIVGESGSGKSTVALAVLGLLGAGSATVTGSVRLRGEELIGAARRRLEDVRGRHIAMVFQDPLSSLNPYLTVGLQVAEACERHLGMTRRQSHQRARELLDELGVADAAHAFRRHPHQYSGGMRQRSLLASGFAADPALLIADEPTTALDVITQARVLGRLRERLTARGMALLLITHNLGIVAGLCDRVIVMRGGTIVEQAAVRELYRTPRHDYTRRLLAAVPRLDTPPPDDGRPARDGTAAAPGPGEAGTRATATATDAAIEVREAIVEFPRPDGGRLRAVDGVSFSVRPGEVFGLVGQSGSGKSTLVRAVAGLQALTSGEVRIGGTPVTAGDRHALRPLWRRVQMVFQDPLSSLNARFTVARIVAEPLVNFGILPPREARRRVDGLLAAVSLDPALAARYPHELSGGQCQRVSLARALAVEPEILLCDEPLSALDVSVQAEILALLRELRTRLALTVLFVSHDLAVVRHLADRVAVMHEGRLVEVKAAASLYAEAEHPYTRALLAAVPIPDPAARRY